jgi:flagellar P-ring protein precursor FlgI
MTARHLFPWAAVLLLSLTAAGSAGGQTRIGELTRHPGEAPRRLVGYGLVVGLDGTGDRSFGSSSGATPSVRSVVNMLRRFGVEVPGEQLRMRNVAAVVVTAEVSPYLRAGNRFEVQVSALSDASSLRGGVLWVTPLVTDPDEPAIATAQGPLYSTDDNAGRGSFARRSNAARIAQGGVLEVDPPPAGPLERKLLLREPDLSTATRIAAAINGAFGDGTARVEDPGAVTLERRPAATGTDMAFFAAVDTMLVTPYAPARLVLDSREGTLVAGGDIPVGPGVIHHHGVTLQIGGSPGAAAAGLVRMDARASVQDVAAGLHAAGVRPEDMAAIFEALQASGALHAQVVVR